jgi:hypothetical protein
MHGTLQAQVMKSSRFAVYQIRNAEALRKPSKLSQSGPAFLEVHEMRDDSALSEEPQGLAGVRAFARSEDLNVKSPGCRA